jgi:Domain of unknown function (DUF4114)
VKFIKIITALFLATLASSAIATEGYSYTPSSDKLYVTTAGDVILTFVSKDAAFSNDLFLQGKDGLLLNNQSAVPNAQINLGAFAANTLLTFKMTVTNTGLSFFTGDASSNPDSFIHAAYDGKAGQPLIVGFEDLFGGGDQDYNDLVFSLTNVYAATGPTPVPEPESFAMLAAGLLLIRLTKNRKS